MRFSMQPLALGRDLLDFMSSYNWRLSRNVDDDRHDDAQNQSDTQYTTIQYNAMQYNDANQRSEAIANYSLSLSLSI